VTRQRLSKRVLPILLLLPLILWLVLFALIPMLYGLWLSLHDVFIENFNQPTWVGLANYRYLIRDPSFLKALRWSLKFALLSVPIQMVFGLAIAMLYNRRIRGKGVGITMMLLPLVVSPALIGTMFRLLFNEFVGPIHYLLKPITGGTTLLGMRLVNWTIIGAYCLTEIPFVFINTYASLQAVPTELLEAAEADGASGWQRFWRIIFPLIMPIVGITFLESMLAAFLIFALVYTLTSGGPGDLTQSASLFIYTRAFVNSNFGLANAASFSLALLLLLPALATVKQMMRSLR
jgi:multiple sugar transport system permease protein